MDTTLSTTVRANLPLNYMPQSKEFLFEEDNLIFSSKFDSGNLFNVVRSDHFNVTFKIFKLLKFKFKLQISSDALGIQQEFSYRTWFYFSLQSLREDDIEVDLTFINYANQTKLYGNGYRFVYKEEPENYNPDEDYEEDEEFRWKRYNREIRNKVK